MIARYEEEEELRLEVVEQRYGLSEINVERLRCDSSQSIIECRLKGIAFGIAVDGRSSGEWSRVSNIKSNWNGCAHRPSGEGSADENTGSNG